MNDLPLLPDSEGNPHSISLDTIMGGPNSKSGTQPIATVSPVRARELPHTGSATMELVLLALALILAGVLLRTVSGPVRAPAVPPVVTPAS